MWLEAFVRFISIVVIGLGFFLIGLVILNKVLS